MSRKNRRRRKQRDKVRWLNNEAASELVLKEMKELNEFVAEFPL